VFGILQTLMRKPSHVKASLLTRLAFLSILFVTSNSAWALFSDDEARRAILDLRARVEALSTRITELDQRIQSSAQGQLELLNENERLRSELAKLRGKLEETGRATVTGKDQQKDLFSDLDQRLKKLEPVPLQVNGKTYLLSPAEEKKFQETQTLLKAGEFQRAAQASSEFERLFPASALGPRVLFDRGTALYAAKDYANAITARQEFINRYLDHPQRPQAILNLAAAQAESGTRITARTTLLNLIRDYPNSDVIPEAKSRLKELPPVGSPAPAATPKASPAKAAPQSAPAKAPAPKPATSK
jgi:TolA-binding protein